MLRSLITPRTTRAAIACGLSLVLACIALAIASAIVASDAYGASTCSEDASCWTWPRMGNHKRGVVTVWGNVINVGPCQYARLYRAHRLDPHNVKLRGDVWARTYGCAS